MLFLSLSVFSLIFSANEYEKLKEEDLSSSSKSSYEAQQSRLQPGKEFQYSRRMEGLWTASGDFIPASEVDTYLDNLNKLASSFDRENQKRFQQNIEIQTKPYGYIGKNIDDDIQENSRADPRPGSLEYNKRLALLRQAKKDLEMKRRRLGQ